MPNTTWDRGRAEQLYAELLILDRAYAAVSERERQERDDNPRSVRPEACRARPETVKLREAIEAKIAEGDAELLVMVANYVELWPAASADKKKKGGR